MKLQLSNEMRKRLEVIAGRLLSAFVFVVMVTVGWDVFAWPIHGWPLISPLQAGGLIVASVGILLTVDMFRSES